VWREKAVNILKLIQATVVIVVALVMCAGCGDSRQTPTEVVESYFNALFEGNTDKAKKYVSQTEPDFEESLGCFYGVDCLSQVYRLGKKLKNSSFEEGKIERRTNQDKDYLHATIPYSFSFEMGTVHGEVFLICEKGLIRVTDPNEGEWRIYKWYSRPKEFKLTQNRPEVIQEIAHKRKPSFNEYGIRREAEQLSAQAMQLHSEAMRNKDKNKRDLAIAKYREAYDKYSEILKLRKEYGRKTPNTAALERDPEYDRELREFLESRPRLDGVDEEAFNKPIIEGEEDLIGKELPEGTSFDNLKRGSDSSHAPSGEIERILKDIEWQISSLVRAFDE
jgi:hypothetical protein